MEPGASGMRRFERTALYGSLLVALPGVALAVALTVAGEGDSTLRWILCVAAIVVTVLLARWLYRRLVFPLYVLGGLLEALREGDYSLRGARDGALGGLVCDFNALAQRLQRERVEFEESSHLLSKTLSSLNSAVFTFDENMRLRLANPAGRRLLGMQDDSPFGQSAAELGLAVWMQGPVTHVLTHAFPARTGRFEVLHSPLRSGGHGGHLLVINDVGRVLREEERQAWQRLLMVLGHEVNNSLAPIRSMAGTMSNMVAREPLPAGWREDFFSGLEVIGHRAESLSRFLSSYSKLARLPAPQKQAVELSALAEKLSRLEQRLSIQVETAGALRMRADPDQLEQALINLLNNAVDAALATGGGVRLRWRREGELARIEIEDDGPGLASVENLFVPFFTTKPGGSGIGLALARLIAEAHDGGVTLNARADAQGALACLWLPLEATEERAD